MISEMHCTGSSPKRVALKPRAKAEGTPTLGRFDRFGTNAASYSLLMPILSAFRFALFLNTLGST